MWTVPPPPPPRTLWPRIAIALAIFLAVQAPVTAPFGRELWTACATATLLTLPLTLLLWCESARWWTRLMTCLVTTAVGVMVTGVLFGVLITWRDGSVGSDGPVVHMANGLLGGGRYSACSR